MTDSEQLEAWQRTSVPKATRAAKNLSTGNSKLDMRPMTRTDIARQAGLAQHGACVDHVEVAGLSEKVCILRGQDRAQVIAEARQLAGVAE